MQQRNDPDTQSKKLLEVKYKKIEKVVEGHRGTVFKAMDKRRGNNIVALKKVRLENEEDGVHYTTLREIATLKALSNHPNIVSLLDVIHQSMNKKLYLVFEFVEHDLERYLATLGEHKLLHPDLVRSYMHQLLKGLAFCHSHGILHRDLKPQNLLVDREGVLKIAGFGLARATSIPVLTYTDTVVTLWYRSPEIILVEHPYSMPVDIWSVGCIFAEMVMKRILFLGHSEIDQLFKIFQRLGTPNETTWPGITSFPNFGDIPQWQPVPLETLVPNLEPLGLDLLAQMLHYAPSKRITALAALKHPYFASLDER